MLLSRLNVLTIERSPGFQSSGDQGQALTCSACGDFWRKAGETRTPDDATEIDCSRWYCEYVETSNWLARKEGGHSVPKLSAPLCDGCFDARRFGDRLDC